MTVVTEQFNGNVYIVIPGYIGDKKLEKALTKLSAPEASSQELIKEMTSRIESEISSHVHRSLKRYCLGSYKLACFDDLECCSEEGRYEQMEIVATVDENTRLVVVMLVLQNKQFMVSQLLDRVSADKLILKLDNGRCCNISQYLFNKFGIHLLSSAAKTCLSTRKNIPDDILPSYLASETYNSEDMDAQIVSPEVGEQISANIAQYDSSDIYAGKNCVLRVDRRPGEHDVATLASDTVFLFILEILAFKESAVLRTNTKTIEAISDSKLLEMTTMDQLTSEFSLTMPFWDIQIFHYVTAQNLANKLDNSFGIEKHFTTYDNNQQFLQHKINIRQAIQQGNEDKILFLIALILFVFEIAPYLFTLYQRLLDEKWYSLSEIYSILGSGVSTWVLVLLIVMIIKQRKRRNGP